MKLTYILRYACRDLWHFSNRPFSMMNVLAIAISVCILVLLTGGFLAFRQNSDKFISGRDLKIEVSMPEEGEISAEKKQKLEAMQEVSVFWWTPTLFMFYDEAGVLKAGMGGQTVDRRDPLMKTLQDVAQRPLNFFSKEELNARFKEKGLHTNFDEFGLIVPFSMLKQLEYLPKDASQARPESWINTESNDKTRKALLNALKPLLENFVKKLDPDGNGEFREKEWLSDLSPFSLLLDTGYGQDFKAWDRNEDGVVSRHELYSVVFPKKLRLRVTDVTSMDIELPVVGVIPDTALSRYMLTRECYQILGPGWNRDYAPFLYDRDGNRLCPEARPNPGFKPQEFRQHAETHASVYVKNRANLLSVIEKVRAMGLKADCPMEDYLQNYEQQETFFIVAAGCICMALFFFAGVVLFANFHGLILRKFSEIGILKACGVSRALISRIFSLESFILCFLSLGMGVGSGFGGGKLINKYIQQEMQKSERPDLAQYEWFTIPPEYLAVIVVFGLLFGWLVTLLPVRTAASIDPDQVIRT